MVRCECEVMGMYEKLHKVPLQITSWRTLFNERSGSSW